jgi:hypothetical protein
MPVESFEVGAPPADVRFEQPEGPFVVGGDVDTVQKSTGLHEHNPGGEDVTVDWHDQTPSGQFEQPGPEVVELDGWKKPSGDAQTKVVDPPADVEKSGTTGVEVK